MNFDINPLFAAIALAVILAAGIWAAFWEAE
jgi:hypothetical protein